MSTEPTKVLVVEDNMADARLLYEGLSEALPGQLQLTHVRRLSEALEWLWDKACDVVLLDLGLPDSHGLDTLFLMRAQAPDVPLVVLTGFQDEALAVEALQEGAQDYLAKGETNGKILARSLRYAIARKGAQRALTQQALAMAAAHELRRSRERIIAANEGVRREVAAELEGRTRTKLLAVRDRLQEAIAQVGARPDAVQHLREAHQELDLAISGPLAALARRLYPFASGEGLVQAFQSLDDEFDGIQGLELALEQEIERRENADHDFFPEPVRLAAYRVAQGSLSAASAAQPTRVVLTLKLVADEWLVVKVWHNGSSDQADPASRPEATVMEDYAQAVGGTCAVTSALGSGTEVVARLPFRQLPRG